MLSLNPQFVVLGLPLQQCKKLKQNVNDDPITKHFFVKGQRVNNETKVYRKVNSNLKLSQLTLTFLTLTKIDLHI